MTHKTGKIAVVRLTPADAPEILMVEIALSSDDKITIADKDEQVTPGVPDHIRMLAGELIEAVLEEVNKP